MGRKVESGFSVLVARVRGFFEGAIKKMPFLLVRTVFCHRVYISRAYNCTLVNDDKDDYCNIHDIEQQTPYAVDTAVLWVTAVD